MWNAIRICIAALVPIACSAGWSASVWPASSNSPRELVTTNYYAKDAWAWECWSGQVERAQIINTAAPQNPSFYRNERSNVVAYKEWIANNAAYFVDTNKEASTTFNDWFCETNRTAFPMLSVTALVSYLGLPTNYFTYTPFRQLNGCCFAITNQYTQAGFSTLDYGWDGIQRALNLMVWTAASRPFTNIITLQASSNASSHCLSEITHNEFVNYQYGLFGVSGDVICTGFTLFDESSDATNIVGSCSDVSAYSVSTSTVGSATTIHKATQYSYHEQIVTLSAEYSCYLKTWGNAYTTTACAGQCSYEDWDYSGTKESVTNKNTMSVSVNVQYPEVSVVYMSSIPTGVVASLYCKISYAETNKYLLSSASDSFGGSCYDSVCPCQDSAAFYCTVSQMISLTQSPSNTFPCSGKYAYISADSAVSGGVVSITAIDLPDPPSPVVGSYTTQHVDSVSWESGTNACPPKPVAENYLQGSASGTLSVGIDYSVVDFAYTAESPLVVLKWNVDGGLQFR